MKSTYPNKACRLVSAVTTRGRKALHTPHRWNVLGHQADILVAGMG